MVAALVAVARMVSAEAWARVATVWLLVRVRRGVTADTNSPPATPAVARAAPSTTNVAPIVAILGCSARRRVNVVRNCRITAAAGLTAAPTPALRVWNDLRRSRIATR